MRAGRPFVALADESRINASGAEVVGRPLHLVLVLSSCRAGLAFPACLIGYAMKSNLSDGKDGPKITVQYRTKRGKVYELTSLDHVLAVQISPRENASDAGNWHVEARLGTAPGPSIVDAWGATPAEALHEVARVWSSRPSLAIFNWENVASALHAVGAV